MVNGFTRVCGPQMTRLLLLGAVAVGVLAAGCGSAATTGGGGGSSGGSSGGGGGGKTLNVALVTDLTGTNAPSRKPFNEGVLAFFKTYPTAKGSKFKVQIYDGQSNPSVGPSVFRHAISNGPVGIIDFTLSTSTAAAAPIIAQSGAPCLCIGGADSWYTPKPYPWAFQANPTGAENAEAYELGMQKLTGGSLKGKRFAISGDNTSFLVTNEKDTVALAGKHGWAITTTKMGPYTEVSWSSEAAEIAKTNPNGVFDITIAAPQIVQVKAMEAAGLTKVPIVSFPGLQYSDLTSLKLPNLYMVSSFPYGTAPSTGLYQAAKKYGYLSDEVSYEFAFGWIQAAVLRQALINCGNCTGSKLEKSMESLSNYTVPGGAAFGPISFSPTSHAANLKQELLHWDPKTRSLRVAAIVSPPPATQ
jgi:ABC-type branched-subunit amino acid transport system substrate-binding protein